MTLRQSPTITQNDTKTIPPNREVIKTRRGFLRGSLLLLLAPTIARCTKPNTQNPMCRETERPVPTDQISRQEERTPTTEIPDQAIPSETCDPDGIIIECTKEEPQKPAECEIITGNCGTEVRALVDNGIVYTGKPGTSLCKQYPLDPELNLETFKCENPTLD